MNSGENKLKNKHGLKGRAMNLLIELNGYALISDFSARGIPTSCIDSLVRRGFVEIDGNVVRIK